MKINILTLTCALFFSFGRVYAQEIVAPLDIPLFLSGNFGELRNDHFHSGLDFKTQGGTGFPVKSVKGGFISRISVSPYGFGRAVYIDHPDGTTSVYGHLERFNQKIESAVADSQYVKESFAVNLFFSALEFPVKQGEVVAYSGNSGSSGGPHLHFELRNTKSEKTFDPLPYLKNKLKDSRPPEIRSLIFVPQPGKGSVNGGVNKQVIDIVKDKNGKYRRPEIAIGKSMNESMLPLGEEDSLIIHLELLRDSFRENGQWEMFYALRDELRKRFTT
jgi:hypothetical protein